MRFTALVLITASLAVPIPVSAAHAVPPSAAGIEAAPSSDIQPDIQEAAAPRCGRHAHYVRGHRARNGRWVKGVCVRNRHR
jgi:hypothetical protein